MSSLTTQTKRQLIATAHSLRPYIIIGNQGITAGILDETKRALFDHELIKARLPANGDRDEKLQMANQLAKSTDSECLKVIGRIAILYRHSTKKKDRSTTK